MPDLLLELFSEEIPARMQAQGAENLKKLVTNALVEAGLVYEAAVAFATPRRLTLNIVGLPARQPDTKDERKGPRVGAPEKALEGFLRAAGLSSADDAQIVKDDKKGDYYLAVIEKPGRASEAVIAEIVPEVIRSFPWPKSMRWGAGNMRWVRPLQSILCTFGPETEDPIVVDFEVGGVKSGNITHGHRFMGPDPIVVRRFEDYVLMLEKAFVILDSARRREIILADAKNAAFAQGLELVEDDALLSEVAGLVEWPVVLMGQFDEAFLDVPPEVLTISMKSHQKCFSLRDPNSGKLANKFILVANLIADDGGRQIIAGNEKVIAARLSDARFFWEQDLKTSLEDRLEKLQDITFHEKLGTQAERVERIRALAREIAPLVGADPDLADRAAQLCKADLVTEMVGEFPDLQGLMGKYYALKAGEDASVAAAIEEHYKPQGPSDAVPTDPVAIAVALADKLDILVGFWVIDEKPTGSKDPFALRRAALGVIRTVLESKIQFGLFNCFHSANHSLFDQYKNRADLSRDEIENLAKSAGVSVEETKPFAFRDVRELVSEDESATGFGMRWLVGRNRNDLLSFFHDRLKVYLRDTGARHDLIDAVLNSGRISTSPWGGEVGAERRVRGSDDGERADDPLTPTLSPPGRGGISENDDLLMIVRRVEALGAFLETDDGANLLAGIKRATNILRIEEKKDACEYTQMPDGALFVESAETALNDKIGKVDADVASSIEKEDFAGALTALASLRAPVDAFFDHVKVNADEPALRTARLNLLNRIRVTSSRIANFSKIEG